MRPKNHATSETVRPFSPTPFARDSLVLRTLHDLSRNKKALSSLKCQIFTKILFTVLLQSLSFSWFKWLVLDQFTATSCSQRIRLEIPTSCSVLFSLFRFDSFAPPPVLIFRQLHLKNSEIHFGIPTTKGDKTLTRASC